MNYISSLIVELTQMEEFAGWIEAQENPDLGVELIAFTHDQAYWQRLETLLPKLSCSVSFHGPYIGIEGTALPGTEEQTTLFTSYEKVFGLAAKHGVSHIVFHYSQKGFSTAERKTYQGASQANLAYLLKRAEHYGVRLLVENLADPLEGKPLYSLKEFDKLLEQFPRLEVIIDVGHAYLTGMSLRDFMAKHGKRIRAFHFHNNDGQADQHRAITDGVIEYDEIANWYRAYTPGRDIVLEYEPHVNLSQKELLEQVGWLRETFEN